MAESESGRVIAQKTFRNLVKSFGHRKSKLQSLAGELGETIKTAVDTHNLHRGAFSMTAKLDRMDEMKRADFLRSFDRYREYMESAGGSWSAAPDLADQAEAENAGPSDEEITRTNVTRLQRGIKPLAADATGLPGAPEAETVKH